MLGRGFSLIVTSALAAWIHLALMAREIVTMTLTVQACLCVEVTIVKVDQKAWTVAPLSALTTLTA